MARVDDGQPASVLDDEPVDIGVLDAVYALCCVLFEHGQPGTHRAIATNPVASPCKDAVPMSTVAQPRTSRLTAVMRNQNARVTPLELFFDLVFVLALTQCTALIAATPTWEGLARACSSSASCGGRGWATRGSRA
jgi:hypothetical protein